MVKIDLHIHTIYSPDSVITAKKLHWGIKKSGIDGVAITDHNRVDGALKIAKEYKDFIIIPGIEIETPYGHLLLLNIKRKPGDVSNISAIRDFVNKEGGVIILAHPLTLFKKSKMLNDILRFLDAIEVANSHDYMLEKHYKILLETCKKTGIGWSAGSDSHIPDTIGYAYIETEGDNIDDILEDIRKGKCRVYFRGVSITQRVKKLYFEALRRSRLYKP